MRAHPVYRDRFDTKTRYRSTSESHLGPKDHVILALKVILLDRLQGIICTGIQEPYILGVML